VGLQRGNNRSSADVRETLNGDVLVGWRRYIQRLTRRGSTARNSAVLATATTTWCQTPVGRCHVRRVLCQLVENAPANAMVIQ